jgi:UDP-glucuronate decarboxylase
VGSARSLAFPRIEWARLPLIDDIILKDLRHVCDGSDERHFSEKKVLISGGAGFIGSWLADALLDLGASVTCVDNLSTGEIANINHLLGRRSFSLIQADVVNFTVGEKYDYLLHLASRVSPEDYQQHPIETLLANSLGSYRMLELARKMDSRILYPSSSEAYGDARVVPTPEDYWGNVNPTGPRSCYDEGKRFSEALFMGYKREYGLDVRVARVFNSYGPRIRATGSYARVAARFIRQALSGDPITVFGDGSQTRSLCYIADTILGLLMLLTAGNAAGEVVNVGAPEEIRILDLAKKIKGLAQSESPIVFCPLPAEDPKRRCPDISKAKRVLGWTPTISLNEGLKRTIKSFMEQGTHTSSPYPSKCREE